MRINEHDSAGGTRRRCNAAWTGLGTLLAMLLAGAPPALAETMTAMIPSTTAHYFSSRPMIAGTVVSVNDHHLVIDTEQGERVTMEVDSRTLVPRDLGPGMTVRTEFAALENCRFHAERVLPVRAGMSSRRLQAYANTRDGRAPTMHQASFSNRLARNSTNAARVANDTRAETRAIPGTAGYQESSRPMLSGRVLSVNDHRVVVQTDQGRRVAMVMDSRTLVSRELAPGTELLAEFRRMQDGRYYAQRISLIDPSAPRREQAYANTIDFDAASAALEGDCESVQPTPGNSATSAVAYAASRSGGRGADGYATADSKGSSDRYASNDRGASSSRVGDASRNNGQQSNDGLTTLPQTASGRPLFLLLGLIALGAAGAVTFARLRTT